ncbi:MAG: hypothetical protein EFT35_05105 [Methanophagales archaeon ANME-1-THS]|nr:MAG: hypothetical protein EFT35_05105 [Methanophagales archaeon ANME-1-THS]
MTAGDIHTAEDLEIWLISGDGRSEHLVKMFPSRMFQTTLAAQHNRDYRVVVGKYAAALGTRGDYFLVKVQLKATALAAATDGSEVNHMFLELVDLQNVPAEVQLSKAQGGYGAFSPFPSPALRITREMLKGITAERLGVTNTVTAAEGDTYVTQTVNGASDSRFQVKFEHDIESASVTDNEFWFRMKPTSSNVFLIRPDSEVWVLYPNPTTGNGFGEYVD